MCFADLKRSPVCVLFCGLSSHFKPELSELIDAFEDWIPNLDLHSLVPTIRVNFACAEPPKVSSAPSGSPSKFSCPPKKPSCVVHRTTTGNPAPDISQNLVTEQSKETAFYTMQTVRIMGEDVLVLFDSGSNAHLIDCELAERLRLKTVSKGGAFIKAVGGKTSWTKYGEYSVTLGPNVTGVCHELRMRGVPSITSSFPEVDLTELWTEANTVLRGSHILPKKIGGAKAGILIGIKSAHLTPRLKFTLPSGLGVFESTLTDIFGSSICFGGPHRVFTNAYKQAGTRPTSAQVLFTGLGGAYWTATSDASDADIVKVPDSTSDLPIEMNSEPSTESRVVQDFSSMSLHAADAGAQAQALEARLRVEFATALEKMREEMKADYDQKLCLIRQEYQDSLVQPPTEPAQSAGESPPTGLDEMDASCEVSHDDTVHEIPVTSPPAKLATQKPMFTASVFVMFLFQLFAIGLQLC